MFVSFLTFTKEFAPTFDQLAPTLKNFTDSIYLTLCWYSNTRTWLSVETWSYSFSAPFLSIQHWTDVYIKYRPQFLESECCEINQMYLLNCNYVCDPFRSDEFHQNKFYQTNRQNYQLSFKKTHLYRSYEATSYKQTDTLRPKPYNNTL